MRHGSENMLIIIIILQESLLICDVIKTINVVNGLLCHKSVNSQQNFIFWTYFMNEKKFIEFKDKKTILIIILHRCFPFLNDPSLAFFFFN